MADFTCQGEGQRRYCTATNQRAIEAFSAAKLALNRLAALLGIDLQIQAPPEVIDAAMVQVLIVVVKHLVNKGMEMPAMPVILRQAATSTPEPDQFAVDAGRLAHVLTYITEQLQAQLDAARRKLQRPASEETSTVGKAPVVLVVLGLAATATGAVVLVTGRTKRQQLTLRQHSR